MKTKLLILKNKLESQGLYAEAIRVNRIIKIAIDLMENADGGGQTSVPQTYPPTRLPVGTTPPTTSSPAGITPPAKPTAFERYPQEAAIVTEISGNYPTRKYVGPVTRQDITSNLATNNITNPEPESIDYIDLALTVTGLIPVVGIIPDIMSLFYHGYKGQYKSMVLDFIGIIPEVGTALKIIFKAIGIISSLTLIKKAETLKELLVKLQPLIKFDIKWNSAMLTLKFVVDSIERGLDIDLNTLETRSASTDLATEVDKKLANQGIKLVADDEGVDTDRDLDEYIDRDYDYAIQVKPTQDSEDKSYTSINQNIIGYRNTNGRYIKIPLNTHGEYYEDQAYITDADDLLSELDSAIKSGRISSVDLPAAREILDRIDNLVSSDI